MSIEEKSVTPSNNAVIKVIGVGNGGGNAVNRMIDEGLPGMELVAINTDQKALEDIKEPAETLLIGPELTRGLGAGANSEIGEKAALDSIGQIDKVLEGANLVCIVAGMGGGTGSGASKVIARSAKERGILTVAVVTEPFQFEGKRRMEVAQEEIKALEESVDAILVVPNQKLFQMENSEISLKDAYVRMDVLLQQAVKGLVSPLDNLQYQTQELIQYQTRALKELKEFVREKGRIYIGIGEAGGERRAKDAVMNALTSPLLSDISFGKAASIFYSISSGSHIFKWEIDHISETISHSASPDAYIKFSVIDDTTMGDHLRITVFVSGIDKEMDSLKAHLDTRLSPVRSRYSKSISIQRQLHKTTRVYISGSNSGSKKGKNHYNNPEESQSIDDLLEIPAIKRRKVSPKSI